MRYVPCTTHNMKYWREVRGHQHGCLVYPRHRFSHFWKHRQLGQLSAASRQPDVWKPCHSHESSKEDGYFWWLDLFAVVPVRQRSHWEQEAFFSKSKLTLQKWMVLIYWWVCDYPVSDAAEEAHIGRDMAINVYQWLRDVCTTKLLSRPIQLDGPGKVVQIDESLFRHKPKVNGVNLCPIISIGYEWCTIIIIIIIIGSSRTPTTLPGVGI